MNQKDKELCKELARSGSSVDYKREYDSKTKLIRAVARSIANKRCHKLEIKIDKDSINIKRK